MNVVAQNITSEFRDELGESRSMRDRMDRAQYRAMGLEMPLVCAAVVALLFRDPALTAMDLIIAGPAFAGFYWAGRSTYLLTKEQVLDSRITRKWNTPQEPRTAPSRPRREFRVIDGGLSSEPKWQATSPAKGPECTL
jgi:hypothetical protein